MFTCPKPGCDGKTDNPKSIRDGWRQKGTLRQHICLRCGTEFETVQLLRGTLEETIRTEAERLARLLVEAREMVTGTQNQPPVPKRLTSPRLPVKKKTSWRKRARSA